MNPVIEQVTQRIIERSKLTRQAYLAKIAAARSKGPMRQVLSCGNFAHGVAACGQDVKDDLKSLTKSNIAIVSSYNDMLSAHQPYETYPTQLKAAIAREGSVAQFVSGVPAMCDGVTQGQPGMELSLLSRDVIAMTTAIGLSHNMFDGTLMLGICDKIVPGLLLGALSFGHLPMIFVPAGPMSSGLPNKEKAAVRQRYAKGEANQEQLLEAEMASYHSPGTCTFYGTANSNQLVIEMMGLQLPGSSFVPPDGGLRLALTDFAGKQVSRITEQAGMYSPIGEIIDEKSLVNGIVGLLATGGSTNLTMHLVAVAKAAGVIIDWSDFAELSTAIPLLTRIYPNGHADVNHFQQAGGMAFLVKQLLDNGFLHPDVKTIVGQGLEQYTLTPVMVDGKLDWIDAPLQSGDETVLTTVEKAFQPTGGLQLMKGNLGRGVIKTSSLKPQQLVVEAPAVIFESQHDLDRAFQAGDLNKDCVVVVRFQGPRAIGMPELHKLTPPLSVLQSQGYKVALITDGRMSGASGNVPAAIHLTPEAIDGSLLAKIVEGDIIRLDAVTGDLTLLVEQSVLDQRQAVVPDLAASRIGMGRELFGSMRSQLSGAEQGACSLFAEG
ncbi:MAG: phosphogluconate dehydratase [Gammaproteobacteria bacterium]|nr:phosphogluconate dehydratase [Gammaproteobacteria bacterium]